MPLSEIQLRTATIILALPKAAGFALAGGAALVIHEIVDRGTKDLDCFGPSTDAVNRLVDPSLAALAAAELHTQLLRADGFSKIVVADETSELRSTSGSILPRTTLSCSRSAPFATSAYEGGSCRSSPGCRGRRPHGERRSSSWSDSRPHTSSWFAVGRVTGRGSTRRIEEWPSCTERPLSHRSSNSLQYT